VKVVLDSNIYVSAYAFDRDPERILDLAAVKAFRVYSSIYIIEEVIWVLHEKLDWGKRFAELAGQRIARSSTVVPVRGSCIKGPDPVDPNDGPIIKTCLAIRADFLVTRDKDLLSLSVRGTQILTAGKFLRHLRYQGIS
jgi:putative PIN family toxin of toxin-antitoxin system